MKYTFKSQSVVMLRQILQLIGWAKTVEQIYRGGKILVNTLPDLKEGSYQVDDPVKVELSGPERELCKLAFEYAMTKEVVPTGAYSLDIIEVLELVAIDKPTPEVRQAE